MDIRAYFSVKSQLKSTSLKSNLGKPLQLKAKTTDSHTNKKELEKGKKSRKRAIIIDSESDDEEPIPAKPAKKGKNISDVYEECIITEYNSDSSSQKCKVAPSNIQKKADLEHVNWNPVQVSSFFGESPVARSNGVFLSKLKDKAKKTSKTEHIHDDVDFEKTLMQLDAEDERRMVKTPVKTAVSQSPKKRKLKESPHRNMTKQLEVIFAKSPNKSSPLKKEIEKQVKSIELLERDLHQKDLKAVSPKKRKPKESLPKSKTIEHIKVEFSPSPKKTKLNTSPNKNKAKKPLEVAVLKSPNKSSPLKQEAEQSVKDQTPVVKESSPKTNAEKKKFNFWNYRNYLSREGPKALGSKEIPEGEKGCLKGLSFIITGVLESMERETAQELIEKYQGKVMKSVTKNTKYVVVGSDPGPSKMEKAEKFGIKILDEDGLLDLIRNREGVESSPKKRKSSPRKSISPAKTEVSRKIGYEQNVVGRKKSSPLKDLTSEEKVKADPSDKDEILKEEADMNISRKKNMSKNNILEKGIEYSPKKNKLSQDSLSQTKEKSTVGINSGGEEFKMWVDKYKPTATKQIIGQHGEKSGVNKLKNWLLSWHKNLSIGKKTSSSGPRWGNDDGSSFKAALLSGPPGVGKTTSAQLVCKETGFDYFELNASDTRSKRSLKEVVSELLGNQTLGNSFSAGNDHSKAVTFKHAVIMDEVDGMAGNEDRGGIQELISLIKSSKIPIICICNDRSHPKMRSLVNYCFDLCFQRPRVEQIKAAMLSIACKEGINVPASVIQDIIIASNQDIRQVLHNLSLWCAKEKKLTDEQVKIDIGKGTKHIKLNPFDVLRRVFSAAEDPKMTIHDKSDLFFHDYSIAPLFVQENYIHVQPHAAKGNRSKCLQLFSATADSICDGDLIEKQIRTGGQWSLLPVEAIYASVIPGELLAGHLTQMINFPSWLGKNSTQNKVDRLLQELHKHMRIRITGNKRELNMDYLHHLKDAISRPLVEKESEGVPECLDVLQKYCLLREDLDCIKEVSSWPGKKEFMSNVNPKVKAALTRAYNKEGIMTPFSTTSVKKLKKGGNSSSDLLEGEEGIVEDNVDSDDDDDILGDSMVKVKKQTKTAKEKKEEKKPSKSKGRSGGTTSRARH